ncbi:LOB domain-containing protein 31, partial [Cucurbita argyrosperma subsp. sororia]
MSSAGVHGGGPCGACKLLRRKCVKGCIFAPYFDSEQGAAHFAAVHKVFGASNASKLLLRIPANKRVEACVSLCYEALARVRDPVYGCVAHIFSLQQQVVSLQAELAYIQAKLSTLQRLLPPPLHSPSSTARHNPLPETTPGSDMGLLPNVRMILDPLQTQLGCNETTSSFLNPIDHEDEMEEDGELQSLAREFVSRYLPGVGFRPPCSQI